MENCSKGVSEAVRIALQTENDGLKMYEEAGQRISHPLGKKMLLSLAADEKSHIHIIQDIVKGMGFNSALKGALEGTPRKRLKTIFSDKENKDIERLPVSFDDIEILKTAIEFENKGWSFYTRAAKDACCRDERVLFERLAGEESEHYNILLSTCEYLENTGLWFLWEEQGLLDGG